MKRASLTLVFLFVLFITSFKANATIKDFLNNSVIEIENPTSLNNANETVYFGGGIHLRTPTQNFQPFTVIPPSIQAGCGGIDISFGAFSYFDTDQLVSFLKAVASQAPAVFFMTAIRTLCPQCEELQSKLTALANKINSLNFDSCQTAQLLADSATKFLGGMVNDSVKTGVSGPDWLKTINNVKADINDFINNKINRIFSSSGCNLSNKSCYANFLKSQKKSLIAYVLQDNRHLKNDTAFQAVLRVLIGDVYRKGDSGPDSLDFRKIEPISGGKIEQGINALLGMASGRCVKNVSFKNAKKEDGSYPYTVNVRGICDYVESNLDSIINKIKTRQKLTASELQFLSMYKIPVYKLLNTLSLVPGQLDNEALKSNLMRMLSYELLYEILSSINTEITEMTYTLIKASEDNKIPLNPKYLEDIRKEGYKLLIYLNKKTGESIEDFMKTFRDIQVIQALRARIMASLARHPVMGNTFFSQSLIGLGL